MFGAMTPTHSFPIQPQRCTTSVNTAAVFRVGSNTAPYRPIRVGGQSPATATTMTSRT
jgi:hypothetical protein